MAKASKSLQKVEKAASKPAAKKSLLKGGNDEKVTICEIRNLTLSTTITLTDAAVEELSPLDVFGSEITGKIGKFPGTPPAATDNIQVIWGKKTGANIKTKYRGVGGSLTYDATTETLTISELKNVSKISLGIKGVLDIGPEPTEAIPNPEGVAHISVSVGNLNKAGDWIIDFSDKSDGGEGSYVKLDALIKWVKTKVPAGDEEIDLPKTDEEGATKLDLEKFTIVFNDFYVNMTSKSFRFDVASKDGESITFGKFKIKKAGFIITNEPYIEPETPDEESEDEDEAAV